MVRLARAKLKVKFKKTILARKIENRYKRTFNPVGATKIYWQDGKMISHSGIWLAQAIN